MSFNINKLVQPECGGPNPLVSASQQIAMRPAVPRIHSVSSARLPQSHFTNEFMKQQSFQPGPSGLNPAQFQLPLRQMPAFIYNQQPQLDSQQQHSQVSSSLGETQLSGKLAFDYLAEQGLSEQVARLHMQASGSTTANLHPYSAILTTNQPMLNYSAELYNLARDGQTFQPIVGAAAADQLETKYRNDMISQSSPQAHQQQRQFADKQDDLQFWQSLSQKYIGPTTTSGYQGASATTSAQATKVNNPQMAAEGSSLDSDYDPKNYDAMIRRQYLENAPSELDYVFDERNPFENYAEPFTEGLIALAREDIPSAALLFEAAVRKDPQNSMAWRYLGTTQAQNEKDSSAIRALKNCLRLNNQDQVARLAIAVSLANETQHLESCKFLIEWLNNHEKYKSVGASVETLNQLNISDPSNDFMIGERASGETLAYVRDKFLEAARMSPTNPDPDVQSSLGVIFNMSGEYAKAADCFKAALSVKMNDAILWNRLGATLANGYKPYDAVVAYRRALDISPGFLRSRYNLAISLIHMQQYVEASKQLIQILSMQAQGKGMKSGLIRTRSITSASIWNTLRTCATLINRPDLYPLIDGRDLAKATDAIMKLAYKPEQVNAAMQADRASGPR